MGTISSERARKLYASLRRHIYEALRTVDAVSLVDVLEVMLRGKAESKIDDLILYKNNVVEAGFAVPSTRATERRRAKLKLSPIEKESKLLKELVRLARGE